MQSRRTLNGWLAALALLTVTGMGSSAEAGPWRRHRRRVRRRIRRRAFWRAVGVRPVLVVPLAVAVGWELALDNRVVVVKEVREKEVVVTDSDGKTETLEIAKEDSPDNTQELEGSEI